MLPASSNGHEVLQVSSKVPSIQRPQPMMPSVSMPTGVPWVMVTSPADPSVKAASVPPLKVAAVG
jgi:hypothetical protein